MNLFASGDVNKLTNLKELTVVMNLPAEVPCYKTGEWERAETDLLQIRTRASVKVINGRWGDSESGPKCVL